MTTSTIPSELTGTYRLDPAHSRVGFVARHAMITKVRGAFDEVYGEGRFDAQDPTRSWVRVTIRAASIDSRNQDRDAHLRSADFLDVERYPTITFESKAVEVLGDDRFRVDGDLTIKDATRPVSVELELTGATVDPFGNHRIGLEGGATINRKDWGLTWNVALEAGGLLVGERVGIELELSAVRVDDPAS